MTTAVEQDKLTLALETAVGSGSIALLRGEKLIASSIGSQLQPARAEEILKAIKELLEGSGCTFEDLGAIAVSTGPGSYSGIRIGLATAIGLKNAIAIDCIGVSVLDAIAYASGIVGKVVAVVQVGKNDLAWQQFELMDGVPTASSQPKLSPLVEFNDSLAESQDATILAPTELLERLNRDKITRLVAVDSEVNLAGLIGRLSLVTATPNSLTPLYLRAGTGF